MTDPEKLALLDIAFHAKTHAKAAETIVKTLTQIELAAPLNDEELDAKLRGKLGDARVQFKASHDELTTLLSERKPSASISADGPLFDKAKIVK
jgi:hypothetical protein